MPRDRLSLWPLGPPRSSSFCAHIVAISRLHPRFEFVDGRTILRGVVFFNPVRSTDRQIGYNLPGVTKAVLELQVWDERDERLGEAHFSRSVEVYTHSCLGGTLDSDGPVEVCKSLANETIPDHFRVNLGDFRADLGRLGQERDEPPPVAARLEINGTGFSLTSLIRSPEVADVGSIDEDEGRTDEMQGIATGGEWARRRLDAMRRNTSWSATDAPKYPNDAVDPTRSSLRAHDVLYAPPRYEPGWAPVKRFVHVWKRLTDARPYFPDLYAQLSRQALRSGVAGLAIYVTKHEAENLAAHAGVRDLMDRGLVLIVRWDDLPRPLNWVDYDQQFFNAHAALSHWGRNVVLFLSDADEVIELSSQLSGPASKSRPLRRQAEDRAIARMQNSPTWRLCRNARLGQGLYSNVGETRLQDRKANGLPLCSPGDGMPAPTPRQRRLADVMAYGGCHHEEERREIRATKGDAFAELLREPRCATILGNPIYFEERKNEDGSDDVRSDGQILAEAASPLKAFETPSLAAVEWKWTKPLVTPDNTFSIWVHSARACEVSRTQPWGRPAAAGYGAPLPIERLPDGTWNLEATGVPMEFSNADERPPPIRSTCRIHQDCKPINHECIGMWHYINLHAPRTKHWETRVKVPWTAADRDWLWVWEDPESETSTAPKGGTHGRKL